MHSLRYYSVDEGGEQEDGTIKRLSIVGPADDFEAPEADALLTITGWTNHYPKVSTQSTPLVSGLSSPGLPSTPRCLHQRRDCGIRTDDTGEKSVVGFRRFGIGPLKPKA
jgi:hypothetical protein